MASLVRVWRPDPHPWAQWGWLDAGCGRTMAGDHLSSWQTVCRPQEEGCPLTPDRLFKVVFVGDSAVGKTSFLRRFCEDRFSLGMTATVGEFPKLGPAHLCKGRL